jgi:hypothetical protein
MIQPGKPLADHVEILRSPDNALCRCLKLPSTFTTYGRLLTSTMRTSSMMMPFAPTLQPPGLQSIIQSLKDLTTANYVCAPLAPGTTRIIILLTNLKHNMIDQSSINFEDTIVSSYSNLLLHGRSATDITGIGNGILQFKVFDVTHSTHHST